ncbi:uncharacterized protein PITG_16810 [Phytophthora infestans T30-4]|uniref:CCHC-type domain-containing protein n=1 Tax=Phytophthora infestans (strain T30-4) TaxID=403677 RepID=D0NUX5_PHYIT|nr:uncharacterized protein PITG_16810 [Phytophthora infestans T30-4]EEY65498.1 conserved hypothetical protein [Phytophthora infestans T30-4]|eukprot:XP_002897127.1 conserved hypothetical protein [Phytophthora infestans T30-4]
MRYHLLGYVMVRGYDGSQSFTYNGEEVPPRTPIIHVDDEQHQSLIKEETSCGRSSTGMQRGRLSQWDVLGESAEAKGILQRYLHPDVEAAILNKNIHDSWQMLCALYDNRSSPGAHDVYEMHRVLHHIRLGDKKAEPVREFITRWEMLVQQYALATGIELTDAFRSVSLIQTFPSAWRPMVASWRGMKPFVPYAELVEKVVATRERMQAQPEAASPTEQRMAEPARTTNKATDPNNPVLPPIDVTTGPDNTVDLTSGERGYVKYSSHCRFEKSPRKPRNRYEKKYDSYDRFDNPGPVSCFYCLKVGHHMKRCWYLKSDIENSSTHDLRKKFSCAVTIDRSQYMVHCLEAYIDEVNRERAAYGASTSKSTTHGDYNVSESVGRKYRPQEQEIVPPPPPGQPPAYAFRDQQQQASSATATIGHRKRSLSAIQATEGRMSSRDPRLNRSNSVYRSTDVTEDFSPRKRGRGPSFERQLQAFYRVTRDCDFSE